MFPMMCYSDADDELWKDDPYEYIRMKFGQSATLCCMHVCAPVHVQYMYMPAYAYMYVPCVHQLQECMYSVHCTCTCICVYM